MLDNKDNVGVQVLDRGETPTHKSLSGAGKPVRVYGFVTADTGKTITIKGYDTNNNWVRKEIGTTGTYQDGETVTINGSGYVDTSVSFKSITSVSKDATQANVQLYEVTDASTPTLVNIANYEPSETIPNYRRSLIPSLAGGKKCDGDTDGKTSVTVIAKLRFIDAVNDSDILLVSDLYAIKNMAIAIKLEENRDFGAAGEYRGLAFDSLQNQLANHTGDGVVPVIQLTNLNTHGGGGIESLI